MAHDEKENHGRAETLTQGINRGHDGALLTTRGWLAGVDLRAAGAGTRRREVKAQPKVAAKTRKPAAKARPTAKSAKPAVKAAKTAAKPAAKKVSPARPATKTIKPAPRTAVKTAAKTPVKAPATGAKTAATAAPKAAKAAAGKVAAVAKAVVSGAKAVVAAAKKMPAKAGSAAAQAAPAKAVPPTAAPAAARAQPAAVSAQPPQQAQPEARAAQPPRPAAPAAPGAAKASYTPMATTPSVLTPPPVVAIKKDPKLANNWKTKTVEELTDAEVLAMPDSEYMNETQLAFFRLKLQQLKQDILNSAGETTEHLREDTVIVPDPADRATIEEEHALELRTRDRERKLLKKIEQSIARIDAGDYGYCDETGEPIGVGRLLARPTATLSLEAQQRRELKQKMFGD